MEELKESHLQVFEIKDLPLIDTKSTGVFNGDARRRHRFQASVLQNGHRATERRTGMRQLAGDSRLQGGSRESSTQSAQTC